ncbi:uncharacterized protein LOC133914634 [Phragmites australis]|uniref:uncharacterized protein LOC133914634 n=1 Tax=Phragmites australis TaxID=29695 RepID=UPI002D78C223|nr:uncharacterized protein LOC133914634 [Phragmites australis]
MGRRTFAIATALHLLALYGAAVARPLVAATSGTTTSELGLAPAGQRRVAADDAAARVGKWLPFMGGGSTHHLPAAYWAHRPVPWVGAGTSPALTGASAVEGGDGDLVRERERPYVGAATTRQEQLAMWASLLNTKGKGKPATDWLPVTGIGEAADDEPVKGSESAEETEVIDPAAAGVQAGQTYWGNNGN